MILRDTGIHKSGLQLTTTAHETHLLPGLDRTTLVATDFEGESTTVKVLRIFPEGLDTGAKDVDAVFEFERFPREVVVDLVEDPNVWDRVGEES